MIPPSLATLLLSIGIFLEPSGCASSKGVGIAGFLDRLGSIISVAKEVKPLNGEPSRACEGRGGTFAGSQCLEIITIERNFQDARIFCQSKGGDLWAPIKKDFNHAFAPQRYAQIFPELFKSSKEEFYLGIARTSAGGAVNLSGWDVSGNPVVRMAGASGISGPCFLLETRGLHLRGRMVSCSVRRPFICEYYL